MTKKMSRITGFAMLIAIFTSGLSTAAEEDPDAKKKATRATLFTRRPMIVQRDRPPEWKDLVYGGQFLDRFEPMPAQGEWTSDTWGADTVKPRYIDNGLEDAEWSYWGGNALLGTDGKHHLIACRWLESLPKGHLHYFESDVVHAVSDNSYGPYEVVETLFPGHNPNFFQLKDGRYVIESGRSLWVGNPDNTSAGRRFKTLDLFGKSWEEIPFEKLNRQRMNREQSPMAFAMREDGSFLMLTRHGDIWLSKDGLPPYYRVTDERVYPAIAARFEDPAIWRTNVQYHLLTNDWQGRMAYHMRSKDGIHWKLDPGIAYEPGFARLEDGTVNDWTKFEVVRIFQDDHGRAIRANFAALDSQKAEDLGNDEHNSKVLFVPLTPGRFLSVLNKEPLNIGTKQIRVKIEAEEGFDPHQDIDLDSLRFGAPEEVDFGRGSKLVKTRKIDKNLVLIFDGKGNGFGDDNFAGKLLGKTNEGELLFGYSRLPGVNYFEPALSALPAKFTPIEAGVRIEVEVQNFGQVASKTADLKVLIREGAGNFHSVWGKIPPLESFEKTTVVLNRMEDTSKFKRGQTYTVTVRVESPGQVPESITRQTVILQ